VPALAKQSDSPSAGPRAADLCLPAFESAPGFFVTGNLYRPKNIQGRVPGVMFAHGHRQDARLSLTPEATLRKNIADGAERFEVHPAEARRGLRRLVCISDPAGSVLCGHLPVPCPVQV
jgi:hypothetical protein